MSTVSEESPARWGPHPNDLARRGLFLWPTPVFPEALGLGAAPSAVLVDGDGGDPWGRALLAAAGGLAGLISSSAGDLHDPGAIALWEASFVQPDERAWLARTFRDASTAATALEDADSWQRLRRLARGAVWPLPVFLVRTMKGLAGWAFGARERWELAPDWATLALAPTEIVDAFFAAHGGSATALLVRQRLSRWPTWAGLPPALVPRGEVPARPPPSRERELESALEEGRAACRAAAAGDARAGDHARSLAERVLFRHLESLRETRGQFRLNQQVEARWPSGRSLEVDLVCADRRLALEIDGPHHFRDENDWRRDRQKDLLLQQAGWLVVRVLANDVFDRLAAVEATVLTALGPHR